MKSRRALLNFALLAALVLNASAVTRYVDLNSPSPTPPYTNWLTAATNIQDAVDAAVAGDTVLVTNGVYATGGRVVYGALTNRVVVNKALTVQSVNGPPVTMIQGYRIPATTNGNGAVRCVYLTNDATLSGFTLTNGATRVGSANHSQEEAGGGVWCESLSALVTNCVIIKNAAYYLAGGAYSGTLKNSLLSQNGSSSGAGTANSAVHASLFVFNTSSSPFGGIVWYGSLNGCTLMSNTALCAVSDVAMTNSVIAKNSGAGAINSMLVNCVVVTNAASGVSQSTLNNCIVYYNSGQNYGNYCNFRYSCTTPLPPGTGNFTNAPLFVALGGGNLHLQSTSPCINAGSNGFATITTDLDGNPRISGGTVDIGAYEFQSPASVLSYAWAQQNGLPTDGSADFTDADGDGANNWQEWRADTAPTNAASALLMGTATNGVTGLVVSWASVATRSYWLERGEDLSASSPFQTIATNLPGVAGTKTFNDTSATNSGPYFYRVGVQ